MIYLFLLYVAGIICLFIYLSKHTKCPKCGRVIDIADYWDDRCKTYKCPGCGHEGKLYE